MEQWGPQAPPALSYKHSSSAATGDQRWSSVKTTRNVPHLHTADTKKDLGVSSPTDNRELRERPSAEPQGTLLIPLSMNPVPEHAAHTSKARDQGPSQRNQTSGQQLLEDSRQKDLSHHLQSKRQVTKTPRHSAVRFYTYSYRWINSQRPRGTEEALNNFLIVIFKISLKIRDNKGTVYIKQVLKAFKIMFEYLSWEHSLLFSNPVKTTLCSSRLLRMTRVCYENLS